MHIEIDIAVKFLSDFLRPKSGGTGRLKKEQVDEFAKALSETLLAKLTGHWHPAHPLRGSAYRCIINQSVNGQMDPILLGTGRKAGIPEFLLRRFLPVEMALWVDPSDVSYRIGEQGSICSLMNPEKENDITLSTVSQAGGKSSRTNSITSTTLSASSRSFSPEKLMLQQHHLQQQQHQHLQQQQQHHQRLRLNSLRTESTGFSGPSKAPSEQPNDSGIELSPSSSPRLSANTISNSSSPSSSPLASPIREQPPNGTRTNGASFRM